VYGINNQQTARVCGPQKQCYDTTTGVCLNGTTVCPGLDAQLCGSQCYNTSSEVCINGNVQCINSCNGTCYSNSQYCYNNTFICNVGQSVCNIQTSNSLSYYPLGLTCYNSTQYMCSNSTLCAYQYSCGNQCYSSYQSACVNNETICINSLYNVYGINNQQTARVCGPQKQCYDTTTGVCLNGTTVCPGLDAQ
ncbi:unnamed protein product, partial [Adineta steineri]